MQMLKKFKENNKGTTIIIFAGVITGILAFSALVTDVGYLMVERSKLKNTADAAALAAVREMSENRSNAESVANDYIQKNDKSNVTHEILISDTGYVATVKLKKNIFFFFARIFGMNETEILAQSTAKMAPVVAVRGVRPLVIQQQTLIYGQQYTLKEGAGDGLSGNYGAVSLGGTGADRYRDNLKYGYDSVIRLGDYIKTETGNLQGPTEDGINYLISQCDHTPKCTYQKYVLDCPRVIAIPVVNTLDVNGKKPIVVVGFASFFLENYVDNGGHSEITGRFIQTIVNAEIGDAATDYGMRSIKLIE